MLNWKKSQSNWNDSKQLNLKELMLTLKEITQFAEIDESSDSKTKTVNVIFQLRRKKNSTVMFFINSSNQAEESDLDADEQSSSKKLKLSSQSIINSTDFNVVHEQQLISLITFIMIANPTPAKPKQQKSKSAKITSGHVTQFSSKFKSVTEITVKK